MSVCKISITMRDTVLETETLKLLKPHTRIWYRVWASIQLAKISNVFKAFLQLFVDAKSNIKSLSIQNLRWMRKSQLRQLAATLPESGAEFDKFQALLKACFCETELRKSDTTLFFTLIDSLPTTVQLKLCKGGIFEKHITLNISNKYKLNPSAENLQIIIGFLRNNGWCALNFEKDVKRSVMQALSFALLYEFQCGFQGEGDFRATLIEKYKLEPTDDNRKKILRWQCIYSAPNELEFLKELISKLSFEECLDLAATLRTPYESETPCQLHQVVTARMMGFRAQQDYHAKIVDHFPKFFKQTHLLKLFLELIEKEDAAKGLFIKRVERCTLDEINVCADDSSMTTVVRPYLIKRCKNLIVENRSFSVVRAPQVFLFDVVEQLNVGDPIIDLDPSYYCYLKPDVQGIYLKEATIKTLTQLANPIIPSETWKIPFNIKVLQEIAYQIKNTRDAELVKHMQTFLRGQMPVPGTNNYVPLLEFCKLNDHLCDFIPILEDLNFLVK